MGTLCRILNWLWFGPEHDPVVCQALVKKDDTCSCSARILFRTFQGIGGSGLYSLAQIGLFEVGPSHKPGLMGALVGMTLAISFVLGPILGGTISYLASWRWIFFIKYVTWESWCIQEALSNDLMTVSLSESSLCAD
jgi:hypothetical protein